MAGRLPFVWEAMRRLGVVRPLPLDYLDADAEILGRRLWPSTLGQVRRDLSDGGEPLFIKPRSRAKAFTGRVVGSVQDLAGVGQRADRTEIWCSEVLEIASEFRAFLVNGEVVGIRQYDAEPTAPPSDAVFALARSLRPRLPAGCALDVGVISDGRVVLVEANDGFALGRYGLPAPEYCALLLARWRELASSRS